MPANAVKPAIRVALRLHEIGNESPYQLFFAGKGRSGASFGFMQGDLAAGQPAVQRCFAEAMRAAGMPEDAIASLARRLSVHLIGDPLDPGEASAVNAALAASRALVDALDENLLQDIYDQLDSCVSHAAAAGRTISTEALLYLALWINMSGPPTRLFDFLMGRDPHLHRPVPPPGPVVDGAAMLGFLKATSYFIQNPRNLQHMTESVAGGLATAGTPAIAPAPEALSGIHAALPDLALSSLSEANLGRLTMIRAELGMPALTAGTLQGVAPLAAATTGDGAVAALARDAMTQPHFRYEQRTGNLFQCEGTTNDLVANGYSGSKAEGGFNNPDAQCRRDVGPIPRGRYTIGAPRPGPSPFSLPLTPDPANQMCGRSAFLIHGDSIAHPGQASQGCIILKKSERQEIASSGITLLVVVDQMG